MTDLRRRAIFAGATLAGVQAFLLLHDDDVTFGRVVGAAILAVLSGLVLAVVGYGLLRRYYGDDQ